MLSIDEMLLAKWNCIFTIRARLRVSFRAGPCPYWDIEGSLRSPEEPELPDERNAGIEI